ncbi:MAG: protein-tyrosine phosphatase family protein, partial [Chlamydiota bacterium]
VGLRWPHGWWMTTISDEFDRQFNFRPTEKRVHKVALVLKVRKAVREKDGLLAIHCSSGVGRTGTFMAALAIVDAIDKREPFSIEELVCRLSLQRFHSVGKPSQYITLHRLAEEYVISLED